MPSNSRRAKGIGFTNVRNELRRNGYQIGYSSVRELCVATKQRTQQARRHNVVANVKLRRCVKRVGEAKLDTYNRRSFYKTLHYIRDKAHQKWAAFLERDDHAGLRTGSSATTDQHRTMGNQTAPPAAMRHDFMDSDTGATLYATSYRGAPMETCGGGDEREGDQFCRN